MQRLISFYRLAAAADPNTVGPGGAASAGDFWTPGAIAFCAIGLSVLVGWLFRYGGFGALRQTPVRRNRLMGYEPVLLLFVWLSLMFGLNLLVATGFQSRSLLFRQALLYPLNALLNLGMAAVMLWIAHWGFARRLKGFGMNLKTIGRDAKYALVYLLAVYPLIMLSLWAVLTIGQLIHEDFGIQVHQSLGFLADNAHIGLTILVVTFVVVIVPVFEEMLFRGFVQTSIRSLTGQPWVAIVVTAILFAVLHPVTHIPALFFLACGLGYGYERSGSLFRPILMHIFFNGISVAATLLTPS